MNPVILLLVEHDALRARLHGWLADSYSVHCVPHTQHYELCVMDSAYMRRVLLPPKRPWLARLMLHIHTDPELSPWQQADDFISVHPDDLESLRRDEFQARLSRLQAN